MNRVDAMSAQVGRESGADVIEPLPRAIGNNKDVPVILMDWELAPHLQGGIMTKRIVFRNETVAASYFAARNKHEHVEQSEKAVPEQLCLDLRVTK